ncbi:MAG: hypothetical protein NVS9B10_11080 [Nevskia sp.]
MSLVHPTRIDGIWSHRDTGEITLSLADALPWDEPLHFKLLSAKFAFYLSFLDSELLLKPYPDAAQRAKAIWLLIQHRPDEPGLRYIEALKALAAERGVTLRYGPLPSGYIDDPG